MHRVTTLVVGAGQSGLAASQQLSGHGIDHVVLDRAEPGDSWRTGRWDSLRLLTPNWLCRLPGMDYSGPDPDGYLSAEETASLVRRYAAVVAAPVRSGTAVTSVRRVSDGYLTTTDDGQWHSRTVVIANGAYQRAAVPALAAGVPPTVTQLTPTDYRNPDQLGPGSVLVVGASATGAQLAAEIAESGRPVVLAVGEHVRMPRSYRGRDITGWLDRTGLWDERYDQVDDLDRARRLPSPQLVGVPGRTLDLNALSDLGVELVGRLTMIRDGTALFSGGLRNVFALADLKLRRLLAGFDDWARRGDDPALAIDAAPVPPTRVPAAPRWRIDLASGEIGTVVWATGFRPDYSWLEADVVDAKGRLRHDGGVVGGSVGGGGSTPGLYALGLPVLRRRRSSFINGAGADAHDVIGLLRRGLDTR